MHLDEIQNIEVDDSSHYFPHVDIDNPLYMAVALAGEVGEACNEIKKWSRGDFTLPVLKGRLGPELADILIYLVMLAGTLEINLQEEYDIKKEFNDARFGGVPTASE